MNGWFLLGEGKVHEWSAPRAREGSKQLTGAIVTFPVGLPVSFGCRKLAGMVSNSNHVTGMLHPP